MSFQSALKIIFYSLNLWGYGAVATQYSSDSKFNQIGTKEGMRGIHEKHAAVVSRSKRDFFIFFRVKKTGCVRGSLFYGLYRIRGINHGHGNVVHINIDSSMAVLVGMQVDIVQSSDRHSQFPICVAHTACKIAVRSTDRPVFNH